MQVPTVHIKHPDLPDGALINASDFDESRHELFNAPAKGAKGAKDAKASKGAKPARSGWVEAGVEE